MTGCLIKKVLEILVGFEIIIFCSGLKKNVDNPDNNSF